MSSQFDVTLSQQSPSGADWSPAVSEDVLSLEEAMITPMGKIYFDLVPMVLFNDTVAIQRCRKHFQGPHGYTLLSLLNKMKAPKPFKDRARILIRFNHLHLSFSMATLLKKLDR